MGHDVATEAEIKGVGRVDLYDISTKVIYELETNLSPKYRREANQKYIQAGVEVIVIDINELPDDIFQTQLRNGMWPVVTLFLLLLDQFLQLI